jgi:hypothetical protein
MIEDLSQLEAFQMTNLDLHSHVAIAPDGSKIPKVGLVLTGTPITGTGPKTYVTFLDVAVADGLGGPFAQAAALARKEAAGALGDFVTARPGDVDQVAAALRTAGA